LVDEVVVLVLALGDVEDRAERRGLGDGGVEELVVAATVGGHL
jgi:hypothetical protein